MTTFKHDITKEIIDEFHLLYPYISISVIDDKLEDRIYQIFMTDMKWGTCMNLLQDYILANNLAEVCE